MRDDFASCEICGAESWRVVYESPVRDGALGTLRDGATMRAAATAASICSASGRSGTTTPKDRESVMPWSACS